MEFDGTEYNPDKHQPPGGNMTPNEIEILLHCCVSQSIHPRFGAPAVKSAYAHFIENGLIEYRDDEVGGEYYIATERGKLHIKQLCETPWPIQRWVNAAGEFLDKETD